MRTRFSSPLLWILYMSFVHVGQDWYGYGWEVQLLETGFLAIFLCPLLDGRPFPRRPPPLVIIWLFRALIFRIMFGAGMIKMRGDESWRNLTALYYHFETQPIPNGLSRWFHFLPRGLLRGGTLFNHLAELVAPWFVFWPRLARTDRRERDHCLSDYDRARRQPVVSQLAHHHSRASPASTIALGRNSCRASLTMRAEQRAKCGHRFTVPCSTTSWAIAALVAVLSIQPVLNIFSPHQIMNTSFDPLDLVNTYGAFGTVGKERYNVVFEGTDRLRP